MSDNEIRDQLAKAIEPVIDRWTDYHGLEFTNAPMTAMVEELIDAVSSWQPPPRVIETAEELDALQSAQHLMDTNRCGHVASAAVIRDADGDVYARDVDNIPDEISEDRHAGWWQIGTGRDDIDSSTVAFPVTVLWEPEEAGR